MNNKLLITVVVAALMLALPASAAASPVPAGGEQLTSRARGSAQLDVPMSIVDASTSPCQPLLPMPGYELQGEEPPVREEVPATPDDANWPVVRESKSKQEGINGETIQVTQVTRKNPDKAQPLEAAAASNYCTYIATYSDTTQTTVGGVTQYEKVFYYRYKFQVPGFNPFSAYWIYKTQEYWTRTATTYTVGKNTSTWTDNGWTCANSFTTNSATANLTPNWYSSTRTYDYFYDHTKNWATKTPLAQVEGKIQVKVVSPIYKSGSSIGTATTSIRFSGSPP